MNKPIVPNPPNIVSKRSEMNSVTYHFLPGHVVRGVTGSRCAGYVDASSDY